MKCYVKDWKKNNLLICDKKISQKDYRNII
jgi:hypothetical protein